MRLQLFSLGFVLASALIPSSVLAKTVIEPFYGLEAGAILSTANQPGASEESEETRGTSYGIRFGPIYSNGDLTFSYRTMTGTFEMAGGPGASLKQELSSVHYGVQWSHRLGTKWRGIVGFDIVQLFRNLSASNSEDLRGMAIRLGFARRIFAGLMIQIEYVKNQLSSVSYGQGYQNLSENFTQFEYNPLLVSISYQFEL